MSEPIHPNDEEEYHKLLEGQDLTSPIPLDRQDLTSSSTAKGQSLTVGGEQSTELSRNLTDPGQELPVTPQNLTRDEPRLNKLGTILNALSPSKLASKFILQESKQPDISQNETETSILPVDIPGGETDGKEVLRERAPGLSSGTQDPTGVKVWNTAKSQLQVELSKAIFDTWVKDIELIGFGDDALVLGAANDYASEWLNERMRSKIERIITGILGREILVHFMVHDDMEG
jgi:hypothetical protein